MVKFDRLTEGLNPILVDRLRVLAHAVQHATKTYRRDDGQEVTPRYEIHIKMFADRPKTVQVILEQWKPAHLSGKKVMAEISGEHFEAIKAIFDGESPNPNDRCNMSWESYFEQIVEPEGALQ